MRSTYYHAAILVVFDQDLRVEGAWRIPRESSEERFPHSEHVNGRIIRVSDAMLKDEGVQLLEDFSDAPLDQ